MRTRFSVGMAVYDDYDGAYFTAQALLAYHRPWVGEILLVDNLPDSRCGQRLQKLASALAVGRYIPFPDPVGTAAPRDRIFREAQWDHVVVVDCHVLIEPGGLEALADFYASHPYSNDLVQGPLLYDNRLSVSTHFNDEWRSGMWGRWETDTELFPPGQVDVYDRPVASRPWKEIKAQGLGLFACRKSAWLGFHPLFRGFGGEEHYIHEKFRRNGRRCWCVSGLQWVHRFADIGPGASASKYPVRSTDKCRNYVLGFTEIGLDLRPIREHFVQGGLVSSEDWESFVAEARAYHQSADSPASVAEGSSPKPLPTSPPTTKHPIIRAYSDKPYLPPVAPPRKCLAALSALSAPPEEKDAAANPPSTVTIAAAGSGDANSGALFSTAPPRRCGACSKGAAGKTIDLTGLNALVDSLTDRHATLRIVHQEAAGKTSAAFLGTRLQQIHFSYVAILAAARVPYVIYGTDESESAEILNQIAALTRTHLKNINRLEPSEEVDLLVIPRGAILDDPQIDAWVHSARSSVVITRLNEGQVVWERSLLPFLRRHPGWLPVDQADWEKPLGVLRLRRAAPFRPGAGQYLRMAWSYAKFRAGLITEGERLVRPEVAEERMNQCWLCPKRIADVAADGKTYARCGECKCWLEHVPRHTGVSGLIVEEGPGKVHHAGQSCPLGRWGAEENEDRLIPLTVTEEKRGSDAAPSLTEPAIQPSTTRSWGRRLRDLIGR